MAHGKSPANAISGIEGNRYGDIIVLEEAGRSLRGEKLWRCKCALCGSVVVWESRKVRKRKTPGCGCMRDELIQRAKIKRNEFIQDGDTVIGISRRSGKRFVIDAIDYEKVKGYCWHHVKGGYVYTSTTSGGSMPLHRLIMGLDSNDKRQVDHINHDPSDNRRSNLRVVEQKENLRNHKLFSTNTSGYAGVSRVPGRNKWRAAITVDYKQIHLGNFDRKEDAIAARRAAEEKYFGEYSYKESLCSERDVTHTK